MASMSLGEKIKQLRQEKGYSQTFLEKRSGVITMAAITGPGDPLAVPDTAPPRNGYPTAQRLRVALT